MGYVFDVDDKTFWSPSKNVGKTLMAHLAEIESLVGGESGVVESMSDTVEIDIPKLNEFVSLAIGSASLQNASLRVLHGGVLMHLIAFLMLHGAWEANSSAGELESGARLLLGKFKPRG